MAIPNWLDGEMREDDLKRIRDSVHAIERRTSAEIVPLVVRRSIFLGHVFPILLLIHLLFFGMLSFWLADVFPEIPFWLLEVGLAALAVLSAYLQKGLRYWQLALTSNQDEFAAVVQRAELEFYLSGITSTRARTGVLIFVSLLEHRTVVLADRAVLDLFPEDKAGETWKKAVDLVLGGARSGDLAGGICAAVDNIGALLAEKMPRPQDDRNELPDHLLIKE